MGSTRQRSRKARVRVSPEDDFDGLRDVFHARLHSERAHLVTLSAALAGTEENPARIFDDLVFRAHRLRGGAAIFEVAEIAAAANELEQAAVAASTAHANNTDAAVCAALAALVRLIGTLDAEKVPTIASAQRPY